MTETAKLKAAAQGALQPHERLSAIPTNDIFDISLAEGTQLDADITAVNAFHDESTPAKILELIAALEAAERRIAELEEQKAKWVSWAEQASGEVDKARQRIAELESGINIETRGE